MTDREPEKMGGGDPLILRIVLALLYPLFGVSTSSKSELPYPPQIDTLVV